MCHIPSSYDWEDGASGSDGAVTVTVIITNVGIGGSGEAVVLTSGSVAIVSCEVAAAVNRLAATGVRENGSGVIEAIIELVVGSVVEVTVCVAVEIVVKVVATADRVSKIVVATVEVKITNTVEGVSA